MPTGSRTRESLPVEPQLKEFPCPVGEGRAGWSKSWNLSIGGKNQIKCHHINILNPLPKPLPVCRASSFSVNLSGDRELSTLLGSPTFPMQLCRDLCPDPPAPSMTLGIAWGTSDALVIICSERPEAIALPPRYFGGPGSHILLSPSMVQSLRTNCLDIAAPN